MSTVLSHKPMSEKIEASISKPTVGAIEIGRNGLVITSMDQAMEFAKLMAIMKEAVPKHCRDNVGICLAICIQAYEWQVNPIALAAKSYVVNDRLCWESAIYHSIVLRRAPIVGRLKMEFAGKGPTRTCRVWAELDDGTGIVEYVSQEFVSINPKNSPLWKNDPDQQLFYFSVRAFARRHFPDVMAGIYTVDEMLDSIEVTKTVESRSKVDRLAAKVLPQIIEHQPAEPAFIPPERDMSELEPVQAADDTEPAPVQQTQSEPHPEPPTAMGFIEAIENALNATALKKIATDASKAQADGFLDMNELDEINSMIQEAKKNLK